jgi:hypothetical protein
VRLLIPAYVEYGELSKFVAFEQRLYNEARLERWQWTGKRQKIQHAQEVFHMHLTVNIFALTVEGQVQLQP